MIPSDVAEQLYTRLVEAARKRHASGVEVIPNMRFDDFIKALSAAGELSVRLKAEGIDLNHVGMAFDYYSRAIAHMIDGAAKLERVPVEGQA